MLESLSTFNEENEKFKENNNERNEYLFFRIWRDITLKSKIFKEIYLINRFKKSYSFYEISNIGWMIKNQFFNLLIEKLNFEQTLSSSPTTTSKMNSGNYYLQFDNESLKLLGSITDFNLFKQLLDYWNKYYKINIGTFENDSQNLPNYLFGGKFIKKNKNKINSGGGGENNNNKNNNSSSGDNEDLDSSFSNIEENEEEEEEEEDLLHVVLNDSITPVFMETIPRNEEERLDMYINGDELILDGLLLNCNNLEHFKYFIESNNYTIDIDKLFSVKLMSIHYSLQLTTTAIQFIFEVIGSIKKYNQVCKKYFEKYWLFLFSKILVVSTIPQIPSSTTTSLNLTTAYNHYQSILIYLIQVLNFTNSNGFINDKNLILNRNLLKDSKIKEISFEIILELDKFNLLPNIEEITPLDLINDIFIKLKIINLSILKFIENKINNEKFIKSKEISLVNLIVRNLFYDKSSINQKESIDLLWYLVENNYYLPPSFLHISSFYGNLELVKVYFNYIDKDIDIGGGGGGGDGDGSLINKDALQISLHLTVLCGVPKVYCDLKNLPNGYELSINCLKRDHESSIFSLMSRFPNDIDLFENEEEENGSGMSDNQGAAGSNHSNYFDNIRIYTQRTHQYDKKVLKKYFSKTSVNSYVREINRLKNQLLEYRELINSRKPYFSNHINVVNYLLSKGLYGSGTGSIIGQSCIGGCLDIVEILLSNETILSSISQQNQQHNQQQNNTSLQILLPQRSTPVDPLKISILYSHVDIFKLLLRFYKIQKSNFQLLLPYPLIYGDLEMTKLFFNLLDSMNNNNNNNNNNNTLPTTVHKSTSLFSSSSIFSPNSIEVYYDEQLTQIQQQNNNNNNQNNSILRYPILFSSCCSDSNNLEIIKYLKEVKKFEILDRDIIYSIICGGNNQVTKYLYLNRKFEISKALLAACHTKNFEIIDFVLDSINTVGQYISDNNNEDIKILLCGNQEDNDFGSRDSVVRGNSNNIYNNANNCNIISTINDETKHFKYIEKILKFKFKYQNNGSSQIFASETFSIPFINGNIKVGELFLRSNLIDWSVNSLNEANHLIPILVLGRKEIMNDQIVFKNKFNPHPIDYNGTTRVSPLSKISCLDLTRTIVNYKNKNAISILLFQSFKVLGGTNIVIGILNCLIYQSDLNSLEFVYNSIPGFRKYFNWSLFKFSIKFQNILIICFIFEIIKYQILIDGKLNQLLDLVEEYKNSNLKLIKLFKNFKLSLRRIENTNNNINNNTKKEVEENENQKINKKFKI